MEASAVADHARVQPEIIQDGRNKGSKPCAAGRQDHVLCGTGLPIALNEEVGGASENISYSPRPT